MDRSLQSGLEKRTRVGAWQSRVYRLERGYLSAWPDVVSAAAKEDPSRTECLFRDNQVAIVTDQGEKRFRLDFPWDGAKTLSLRANDISMKRAWVDLLQATLKDGRSQIQATGSIFAFGGTSQHAKDEAYEEAAYLKTNRFVAAYVVDEQSRASYVNDLLNELFDHINGGSQKEFQFSDKTFAALLLGQVPERAGGGQEVHRACSGADAAVEELLALTEDFREEMRGVEELRSGKGGDRGVGQVDPSVSAPKIQRFCEEHLSLAGRLVASRLLLELSPFMDSSVAGTSAAPTDSTRAGLVSTRRKLDQAYASADQLVILGARDWFMDIRTSFLDCSGLSNAMPPPPPAIPEAVTQAPAIPFPEEPTPVPAAPATESPPTVVAPTRRSSKVMIGNAFSAAKAATRGVNMGSFSTKREGIATAAADAEVGQETRTGASGMSMRGVFRRGSRSEKEKPGHARQPSSPKQSPHAGKTGFSTEQKGTTRVSPRRSRAPEDEEGERTDLFRGTSRSPGTSPRSTVASPHETPFSPSRQQVERRASSTLPTVSDSRGLAAAASSQGSLAPAEEKRTGRRAFAGGLWGGGGGETASAGVSKGNEAIRGIEGEAPAAALGGVQCFEQEGAAALGDSTVRADAHVPMAAGVGPPKAKESGGKRRFAGGVFSGAQSTSSAAPSDVETNNPFGGGRAKGGTTVAEGGAARKTAGAAQRGFPGRENPISSLPGKAEPVPSWASGGVVDNSVPSWAAGDASAGVAKGGDTSSSTRGNGRSNGHGLAPASRAEQGQDAAEKSPFMKAADAEAPAVRRPSQRRPGESSSRRAFGGGARLF